MIQASVNLYGSRDDLALAIKAIAVMSVPHGMSYPRDRMQIILPDGQKIATPFAEPFETDSSERFPDALLQVGDTFSKPDPTRRNSFALALTFPADAEGKKRRRVMSYYTNLNGEAVAVLANTYLDLRISERFVEYRFSPPSTPFLDFLMHTKAAQQRIYSLLKNMNGIVGAYCYEDTFFTLSDVESRHPRVLRASSEEELYVDEEIADEFVFDVDAYLEEVIKLVSTPEI